MKKENLIYTAALMDGEGSVMLCASGHKGERRRPAVSLTSTTYAFMKFLKETFGGYISRKRVYKKNHSKSWSWSLSNDKALNFLALIVPYMKEPLKVKRAKLLIFGYKKTAIRNGKYSPKQLAAKITFEKKFLAL